MDGSQCRARRKSVSFPQLCGKNICLSRQPASSFSPLNDFLTAILKGFFQCARIVWICPHLLRTQSCRGGTSKLMNEKPSKRKRFKAFILQRKLNTLGLLVITMNHHAHLCAEGLCPHRRAGHRHAAADCFVLYSSFQAQKELPHHSPLQGFAPSFT